MMNCQFCGTENENWYVYCQNCGKKLRVEAHPPAPSFEMTSPDLISGLELPIGPPLRNEATSGSMPADSSSTVALVDVSPIEELAAKAVSDRKPGLPVVPPRPQVTPSDPSISALRTAPEIRDCPACGQHLPRIYRYCGFCSHALDALPGDPPPGLATPLDSAAPRSTADLPIRGHLVRIREDGTADSGCAVREGHFILGRECGDLTFPSDTLLSKKHLQLRVTEGKLWLEDLDSTNGTFYRIRGRTVLRDGDYLLVGKQLLRFQIEGQEAARAEAVAAGRTVFLGSLTGKYEAKLVKRLPNGKDSNEYPLTEGTVIIGREKGDLVFRHDPYVSSKHAQIQNESGAYFLEDLGSSNGTYLRIRGPLELSHEDFFIAGEQLFQVRLQMI